MASTIRYTMVSGICLALNIMIITLLSAVGLHYAVATIISFCLICLIGFALHCQWTFSVERSIGSLIRYVAAMAMNLPLTILLIAVFHDFAKFTVGSSAIIATLILFVWNYVAVKWSMGAASKGSWR